jgi:uncharacterized protein YhbP (UPF0306 family)
MPRGAASREVVRIVAVALARIRAFDPAGRPLEHDALTSSRVRQSVEQILSENVLCAMATVTSTGRPHINTAYFACSRSLELFFLSDPGSVHCRNLAQRPEMAVAVFSTRQTWGRPDRGAQLFGTCRQAVRSHLEDAQRSYARRFPDYDGLSKEAARAFARYRLYRFVPRTLKLLDERTLGDGVFVTASVRVNRRTVQR